MEQTNTLFFRYFIHSFMYIKCVVYHLHNRSSCREMTTFLHVFKFNSVPSKYAVKLSTPNVNEVVALVFTAQQAKTDSIEIKNGILNSVRKTFQTNYSYYKKNATILYNLQLL